jgi:hypothetical protein
MIKASRRLICKRILRLDQGCQIEQAIGIGSKYSRLFLRPDRKRGNRFLFHRGD